MLVRVRLTVLGEPCSITKPVVVEDMPKSTTLIVTVTVWEVGPMGEEAVTVTVYVALGTVPATTIVRMEFAEPVGLTNTIVGFSDGWGPSGLTMAERTTFPSKLFTLVKAIVAVADAPGGMFSETGLTRIVKSGIAPTETVTVVVRNEVPMEPVTVTVYEPVGVPLVLAISSVALPKPPGEILRLCGLSETTSPLLDVVYVRATVPENPFRPVTVIDELPWEPTWNETEDGLLVNEKSVTTTVTPVEWATVPVVVFPDPVIVTV